MKNFLLALFIFLTVVTSTFNVIQYVEGKIATRNLEDKDDLIARYQYEIIEQEHKIANQEHDIWHLTEAEFAFKSENDRIFQELIDGGYYIDDYSWSENSENVSVSIHSYRLVTPEPQIVYVTQNVTVEVERIVNGKFKDWQSLGELSDWVEANLTRLIVVGTKTDCDDYALRLQRKAYEQGYSISIQIVKDGLLGGKNVSNYTELHAGCLALVGNEFYFIEPQPEYFRIVYVCNKD
jgi:hypothetical protein